MNDKDSRVTFKCDTCKFKGHYTTGMDEYPPCTTIEHCTKGNWHGGDTPNPKDIDPWIYCAYYSEKIEKESRS